MKCPASQLPFGWVCFSNRVRDGHTVPRLLVSQLPFGWVCFSNLQREVESWKIVE